jgi:hypothetical protein
MNYQQLAMPNKQCIHCYTPAYKIVQTSHPTTKLLQWQGHTQMRRMQLHYNQHNSSFAAAYDPQPKTWHPKAA